MGCTTSSNKITQNNLNVKIAFKIPHGTKYLEFENDQVVFKININDWISNLFISKKYSHFINYNDDQLNNKSQLKGYCKGFIGWNDKEICWLIHSVPKLIIHFKNEMFDEELSKIDNFEKIYGQSFIFISNIKYTELNKILDQLSIMHPCIDIKNSNFIIKPSTKSITQKLVLSTNPLIEHIAKSPNDHIDIFSNYIQENYGNIWNCQTWIYNPDEKYNSNPLILDNKVITYKNLTYFNSQDNSKYACNDKDYVYIGDLNHIKPHINYGGGGIIMQNSKLAEFLKSIMDKKN